MKLTWSPGEFQRQHCTHHVAERSHAIACIGPPSTTIKLHCGHPRAFRAGDQCTSSTYAEMLAALSLRLTGTTWPVGIHAFLSQGYAFSTSSHNCSDHVFIGANTRNRFPTQYWFDWRSRGGCYPVKFGMLLCSWKCVSQLVTEYVCIGLET